MFRFMVESHSISQRPWPKTVLRMAETEKSRSLQSAYLGFLVAALVAFINPSAYANEDSFQNVAKKVGLEGSLGYGKGVSIIDVDGDGWEDIWELNTNIPLGDKPSRSELFINKGELVARDDADVACA